LKKSVFLVTGGTGFVGQSIVRELVSNNYKVRLISRRGDNSSNPDVSIYQGNITEYNDLKNALFGCTGVIHCAGEKNDTSEMKRINVTVTKNLFSLAQDMNIEMFIHLSSVGVIGEIKSQIIDESSQCNPMNTYEKTKYEAERIVQQGLPNGKVIILRPTNIFGAAILGQWIEVNLMSKFRSFLKGNENAHLVCVDDIANATLYLMSHQPADDVETYIISSDEEVGNTFHDIQLMLSQKISGLKTPLPISAPLIIPYVLRLIKNRATNYGNKIYSSNKLLKTGFKYKLGLYGGLNFALDQVQKKKNTAMEITLKQ